MKRFLQLTMLYFACVVTCGCSPREERVKGDPTSKVKEAVKEVVTKDFDLYKGAKDSLKESEAKHKSELEQMERESK